MNTCEKIAYDNINEAHKATHAINNKKGNKRAAKAYICPLCGRYHITTAQGNIRTKRTFDVVDLKKRFPFLSNKDRRFAREEGNNFLKNIK